MENAAKGYHGYWPTNLDATNDRFGSEADLKYLVARAREEGVRTTADVASNHAGAPAKSQVPAVLEAHIASMSPFNQTKHYHMTNCSMFASEYFE